MRKNPILVPSFWPFGLTFNSGLKATHEFLGDAHHKLTTLSSSAFSLLIFIYIFFKHKGAKETIEQNHII